MKTPDRSLPCLPQEALIAYSLIAAAVYSGSFGDNLH